MLLIVYHYYTKKYDFCLITARDNYDSVNNIIVQIEERLNIKFSEIRLKNRLTKARIAKELNCLYLIDDSYWHLRDCIENGVKGILFSTIKKHEDENIIIFSNWKDLSEFLLNKQIL